MYKISEETYEIAKKNNLIIKNSTKGNYKLDIYDIEFFDRSLSFHP